MFEHLFFRVIFCNFNYTNKLNCNIMRTIAKCFFFFAAVVLFAACEKSELENDMPDNPSENTLSLKKTSASLEYLQVMLLKDVAPQGAVWSVVEGKDNVVSVFNDTLVARGKGTAKVMAQLGEQQGVMMVTVNSDEYIPVKTLKLEVNGKQIVTLSNDSLSKIVYSEEVINSMAVLQSEAIKEIKVVGYEPANATCPYIEEVYNLWVEYEYLQDVDGWRYQLEGINYAKRENTVYCMEGSSFDDMAGKIGEGKSVKFVTLPLYDEHDFKKYRGYEPCGLGFKMQILPDVLRVQGRKNAKEAGLEYNMTVSLSGQQTEVLYRPYNAGNLETGWQIKEGRLKWIYFEKPNKVEVVTNNEIRTPMKFNPETGSWGYPGVEDLFPGTWIDTVQIINNIVIRPGETIQLQFNAQAPQEFIQTAEWGWGGGECAEDGDRILEEWLTASAHLNPMEAYAYQFITLTRDGKLTCKEGVDLDFCEWGNVNNPLKNEKTLIEVAVYLMPSCKKEQYERTFVVGDREYKRPVTLQARAYVQIIPW